MTDAEQRADGRRLRRQRGRLAAIDALIDLVLEGSGPPSAGAVAERAGVSQASLFRYFATLDDLRQEAIGRYFQRFDGLIAIPDIGEGSLEHRIGAFVAARDRFHQASAPMARLIRRHSPEVPDLAESLERLRSTFTDQVAQQFAPELDRLSRARATRRAAAIAALTSFESWDLLSSLGDEGRRAALTDSLAALTST